MTQTSIIASSAPLYSKPNTDAELETECLFGEQFDVVREQAGFAFGQLITDNYEGWVPVDALGDKTLPTHRLQAPSSWLRVHHDVKSRSIKSLSIGSLLHVSSERDEACELLVGGNKCYLPRSHLVDLKHCQTDWVSTAELFLGVPYLWGGRTHQGLDCSALVQLAAQTAQICLPRNTSQQQNVGVPIEDSSALDRGDLVFWPGHVGVMQSRTQLLHANAHHMQVFSEPLATAVIRIEKTSGPITTLRRVG
jgi:cell wall-associated NlpC family hydrolase